MTERVLAAVHVTFASVLGDPLAGALALQPVAPAPENGAGRCS